MVQALETDQHALAAAAGQQRQQLFVMGRIDAHLGDPADLQTLHRAEQLLTAVDVAGEVVVHEEEQFAAILQGSQLGDHCIHRTAAMGAMKETLDGAELTGETTAPTRLHQPKGQVAFVAIDGAVEPDLLQRCLMFGLVTLAQGAVA